MLVAYGFDFTRNNFPESPIWFSPDTGRQSLFTVVFGMGMSATCSSGLKLERLFGNRKYSATVIATKKI
jgi:hypothetical protein